MATELRLRRGTTDEHGNFIGAEAEATVDTDKNTIVVHDGQTQGGFPLSREDSTDVSVDSVATLRTSSFPANLERLYLSGYYAVGTVGARTLYADRNDTTTADDGEQVFVDADGVRWKAATAYQNSTVNDYATLKAIDSSNVPDGFITTLQGRASKADGGGGNVQWRGSDRSADVASDPDEAIWIAPNNDTTGASGAWQRTENFFDADYAARLQAVFDAEWIRLNAGIPAGEVVGLEDGAVAGTGGANTTDVSRITIESETDAQNASSSGSGTINDPYVIDKKRLDNSEGVTADGGFYWNDPNAVYYISLEFSEITGYNTGQIAVINGGGLFVKRSTIYDPSNSWLDVNASGNQPFEFIEFEECLIAGADTSVMEGAGTRYKFKNCVFNDNKNSWVTGASCIKHTTAKLVEIDHCSFATTTADAGYDIQTAGVEAEFKVTNTIFAGQDKLLYTGNMSSYVYGLIKYCRFTNPGSNQLTIGRGRDIDIGYCDFEDSPDGTRQCWLTARGGVGVRDSRVHHCKFTKATGGASAGNESCETNNFGWNVEFDHNWVTECSEDAFEHVNQIGGCSVHHCVADKTAGQAVDIYKAGDTDGNTAVLKDIDCFVHHIYGDCGSYAVIVDDANKVNVHSIFVDNSAGDKESVLIRNRDLTAGAGPNDCKVVGPLTLPVNTGTGDAVKIDPNAGTGNSAVWQEGGRIRRVGQSAEEQNRTQLI